MPEIPMPSGPPRKRVPPLARERLDPAFGLLRWSDDERCWVGKLPITGADLWLCPEPETPEVFPPAWAGWIPHIDRDPVWLAGPAKTKLKELARLNWEVLPFTPTLGLACFEPEGIELYLDLPRLSHDLVIALNSKLKLTRVALEG